MSDGSLDGFAAVFESCFDQVYGYVAYCLAPDLDVASDLTQDVFLAALRSWHSYRGEASALTWLRSIARRKIADHYTDQARQGRRQDCPEAPAEPLMRADGWPCFVVDFRNAAKRKIDVVFAPESIRFEIDGV
jgi:RNA polymerase sigma factor (sigma-70 family)